MSKNTNKPKVEQREDQAELDKLLLEQELQDPEKRAAYFEKQREGEEDEEQKRRRLARENTPAQHKLIKDEIDDLGVPPLNPELDK